MKRRFVSISIKLRSAILGCWVVILLVVVCSLSIFYRDVLLANIIKQLQYEDKLLATTLENRINATNNSCNTVIISLNNTLQEISDQEYPNLDVDTQKSIYHSMLSTFTLFREASQIVVLWDNGICFYQSRNENYTMYSGEEELLKELEQLPITEHGYWLSGIRSDSKIQGEGIYLVKAYRNISSGKRQGYVIIKMKDVFDVLETGLEHQDFYLFDKTGMLIQSTDAQSANIQGSDSYQGSLKLSQEMLENFTQREVLGDTYCNVVPMAEGWTLVSVSSYADINNRMKNTVASILKIFLLLIFVLYIFLSIVIRHITVPIQKLSKHMVGFKTQLPSRFELNRQANDDIKILIDCFNEMVAKNANMVECLLEGKRQQRHLELALLQSQIKPHFLYNTLDTVYCLSCMGKTAEASRVTKLLSDYYRSVLNNGIEEISLREEIKITSNYLELQSIRYPQILTYQIKTDAVIPDINIPKLTLQPLVENAIYHGIKPTGRQGEIVIQVVEDGNIISIYVMDDGVGMTEELFQRCLNMGNEMPETSYGLRNVVNRLQMYYDDACEVSLCPQEKGTTIRIQLISDRG